MKSASPAAFAVHTASGMWFTSERNFSALSLNASCASCRSVMSRVTTP